MTNQLSFPTVNFKSINIVKITGDQYYNRPANLLACATLVRGSGGGGAGCGSSSSQGNAGGGGGGGGESLSYFLASELAESILVTVGLGGNGGVVNGNGGTGTATSFGAVGDSFYINVPSGSGGICQTYSAAVNGVSSARGGAGSLGTGGNIYNRRGGSGLPGFAYSSSATTCVGGLGAPGLLGLGSIAPLANVNAPNPDASTGAGGAGASGISKTGAKGSGGIVIITEYLS